MNEDNIEGTRTFKPQNRLNIFAPCASKIDIHSGAIRDANSSEIFQCCAARCKPKHEFCKNTCHKDQKKIYDISKVRTDSEHTLGRCLANCRIMNVLCDTECKGLVPGFGVNNHYYNCAEHNGCRRGLGEIPSKECVEKKKDIIFKCCRSNCIPTSITDCQELCETLQNTILDPGSLGLPTNLYPWARALENDSTLVIDEGMRSKPQERKNLEEKAVKGKSLIMTKPETGSIYHPLVIALIIGIGISLCVTVGMYLYRKKHK